MDAHQDILAVPGRRCVVRGNLIRLFHGLVDYRLFGRLSFRLRQVKGKKPGFAGRCAKNNIVRAEFPSAILEQSADPPRVRRPWSNFAARPRHRRALRKADHRTSAHPGRLVEWFAPGFGLVVGPSDELAPLLTPGFLGGIRAGRTDFAAKLDLNPKQAGYEDAFRQLRLFKQREMVRIAARGPGPLEQCR